MPRSLIPAPQNDPGQSQVQQGFLAPSQQSYTLLGAGPCPRESKDLQALPHRIFEEGLESKGCFIRSCKRDLLCERSACLLSDEDIERFRKEFVRICNKEVNPPGVLIMRDEICRPNLIRSEKTVNKVHDFWEDEELLRYHTLPEVLKYAECFAGPNIMAMQMMLINKLPDPGTQSSREREMQKLVRRSNFSMGCWTMMRRVPGLTLSWRKETRCSSIPCSFMAPG
ncbi:phytanoyl-CoA dioxygenase, peroxisomal-like [Aquila chrysaetos chrysaetos]|uniref:phytanoyl-CoA dioxygenase, peroxisomal-like n=1 Tax=Aquila chrysaetos chrysaetos TaxID=223781 RepID=UPI0011771A5C|nr:phytanoyl-CoA dioxygenase, peroxisomal-like [Aquila chrysaetos chrysaetos]